MYGQNLDAQLIVFRMDGAKQAEYQLSRRGDDPTQFLVHSEGRKLLVLTGTKLL